MISFDISKTFKAGTQPLTLEFKGHANAGEIVAIHGASGVGKTTLLKMLYSPKGTAILESSDWR